MPPAAAIVRRTVLPLLILVPWATGAPAATLSAESGNGAYSVSLGGRLMWDGDSFDGVLNLPNDGDRRFNGQLRRARMELEGGLPGDFEWIFNVDYVDRTNDAEVHSAGLRYSGWKVANLFVGRDKEPFGLEELTSSKALSTMRRNLVAEATDADSQPHYGVRLDGFLGPVGWSAGVFNPDGSPKNEDGGDRLAFTGRLFGAPIARDDRVLHLGAAFSDRNLSEPTDVRAFALRVAESGDRVGAREFLAREDRQLGLEALWLDGPFSLQGEAFWRDLEGADGAPDVTVSSQYLQLTWTLTGESRGYKARQGTPDMVKPSAGRGAWELVLKTERLVVDPDDGGDDGHVNTLVGGVNYYANRSVKLMFNVSHVTTDDLVDADDEDGLVVSGRIQVAF